MLKGSGLHPHLHELLGLGSDLMCYKQSGAGPGRRSHQAPTGRKGEGPAIRETAKPSEEKGHGR